jgi:hypothetical protein
MFAQSQNNNDSHATTMHSTSSTYAASGQSITTYTVNATTTNVTFPLFTKKRMLYQNLLENTLHPKEGEDFDAYLIRICARVLQQQLAPKQG